MNIILPTMATLSAANIDVYFGKSMGETGLCRRFLGACICLGFSLALIIVHKGEVLAQRGDFAGSSKYCEVPQVISKEDHKVLG